MREGFGREVASWLTPEEKDAQEKREKEARVWRTIWPEFTPEERRALKNILWLGVIHNERLSRVHCGGIDGDSEIYLEVARAFSFLEESSEELRDLKRKAQERHQELFEVKVHKALLIKVRQAFGIYPHAMQRLVDQAAKDLKLSAEEKEYAYEFLKDTNFFIRERRQHKIILPKINDLLEEIEDRIPQSEGDVPTSSGIKQFFPDPRGRRIPPAPGSDFAGGRPSEKYADPFRYGKWPTDDEIED